MLLWSELFISGRHSGCSLWYVVQRYRTVCCWTQAAYCASLKLHCVEVFALSSITSQNVTQIWPPLRLKMPRVTPMCDTIKNRSCLTKTLNIMANGNAVIHSSILVFSIRILLVRHISVFNSSFECTKCQRLINKCITCTQHNNYQKYMIVFSWKEYNSKSHDTKC